ncbi:MAG: hypothetical protein IKZ63_01540, partial [Oscillospiraceae bacterium]|nr:hypothetical protein [Oscillospiraceae bacterium]
MSEKARRLANKKTRTETGLDYVVSALNLLTPFGAKLIKEQKPYFPGQEEALRAELGRVQKMADIAAANEREISVLQETFMMMKDNSFTIERSGHAALSVVEIFEIKSLLLLIDKVRKTADKVLLPEEFVPGDVTDLLDVLDPGKDRLNTFYIYDSFSEKLAHLRSEKKELERESRKEKKRRKNELRASTGLNLTPKFDITISKSDAEGIKMVEEI